MLTFVSTLSFSVYLIHTKGFIYSYVIKDSFISIVSTNPFKLFAGVLLSSLLIFIVCLSIDTIRYALFKLLKIQQIPNFLAKKKCKIFEYIEAKCAINISSFFWIRLYNCYIFAMIQIQNKADCCGCNACGDICPKHVISFKTDIEGFWYPEVDQNLCINCGLCG